MNSEYIITSDGSFITHDGLYHWGIKGMKWGVRRYQNADGSLTAKGRKRYLREDGSLNDKGYKKFGSKKTSEGTEKASKDNLSDLTDDELMKKVNRLRNEESYNMLTEKLGYGKPKTELDNKIAEMEKQKKYLELQRDINNLTPKKESKAKKLVNTLWGKVVEPVAMQAGKDYLTKKLGEAGKKTLEKEAEKIEETVSDSYKKVKNKEAKQQAKQQAKEDKQRTKNDRDREKELDKLLKEIDDRGWDMYAKNQGTYEELARR